MLTNRIFLTKTWGWFPERDPTFGFSQEGARNKFLRESKPGDWIVITGTKGFPTDPAEQGRLLGMCRVSTRKVNAEQILKELGRELFEHELDENGNFKWPWAMPVIEARVFDPQPDTFEIFGTYFPGQNWALYAIDLNGIVSNEAIERLLQLPYRQAEIAEIPEIKAAYAYDEANRLNRTYGSSGPPPSPERGASSRDAGAGYAYAFLLSGGKSSPAIKIGFTNDPKARLEQLNKELRPSLTGCEWKELHSQIFPDETFAFQFEQTLLKRLSAFLVSGEREIVSLSVQKMETAWKDAFNSKSWCTLPEDNLIVNK